MPSDSKSFRLEVQKTAVKPEYCYEYSAEGKVLTDRVKVYFRRTRAGKATGKSTVSRKIELHGPNWVADVRSLLSATTLEKPNPEHFGGTIMRVALRAPSYLEKLTPAGFRSIPPEYPTNGAEWVEFAEAMQAVADGEPTKPFIFLRVLKDLSRVEIKIRTISEIRDGCIELTCGGKLVTHPTGIAEYKRLRAILKLLPVRGKPANPNEAGLYFDPGEGQFFKWESQVCFGKPSKKKEEAFTEGKKIVNLLQSLHKDIPSISNMIFTDQSTPEQKA